MKIYSILKLKYNPIQDIIIGYGLYDESFKTYEEAVEYLINKGYDDIGENQYEIRDFKNNIDYVAEILSSEINLL